MPLRELTECTLALTHEGKAKGHNTSASKQHRDGIGGNDIPTNAHGSGNAFTKISDEACNSDFGRSATLLSYKVMGAGSGFEPEAPENETGMLPLHHPAMYAGIAGIILFSNLLLAEGTILVLFPHRDQTAARSAAHCNEIAERDQIIEKVIAPTHCAS